MDGQTTNTPAAVVSDVLLKMAEAAKVGVSLLELDALAERRIVELGATSYNKGYKPEWAQSPFPTATCISVNSIIGHGIPNEYKLRSGDLVNFDLGIKIGGLCGDASLTVGIGEISNQDERLLDIAKKTTYFVISLLMPGANTFDIAYKTERFVWGWHHEVNRVHAGHRIGEEMHMKPNIYNNTDERFEYTTLKVGEVYCIEPAITRNDPYGVRLEGGWGMATRDGKKSAMFEHMVKITPNGAEILTTHF